MDDVPVHQAAPCLLLLRDDLWAERTIEEGEGEGKRRPSKQKEVNNGTVHTKVGETNPITTSNMIRWALNAEFTLQEHTSPAVE